MPILESQFVSKKELDILRDNSMTLRRARDFEKALKCCDQAIQINPAYIDAYNEKAKILDIQKQYYKAIECCDIAISIDPKNPHIYNTKAITLRKLGDYEGAKVFNKAAIHIRIDDLRVKHDKEQNPHIKNAFNDAINTLGTINSDNYYYDVTIEEKHAVRGPFGIKIHPEYTHYTEKRFNLSGYNKDVLDTNTRLQVESLKIKEQIKAQKLEADRIKAEQLEIQRLEAERLQAEKLELERLELEKIKAEQLEAQRLEKVNEVQDVFGDEELNTQVNLNVLGNDSYHNEPFLPYSDQI